MSFMSVHREKQSWFGLCQVNLSTSRVQLSLIRHTDFQFYPEITPEGAVLAQKLRGHQPTKPFSTVQFHGDYFELLEGRDATRERVEEVLDQAIEACKVEALWRTPSLVISGPPAGTEIPVAPGAREWFELKESNERKSAEWAKRFFGRELPEQM